jgi:ribosomal protein L37E
MKPLKSLKTVPRQSSYKIIEILIYENRVWKILDMYKSLRATYLRGLLSAVFLCGKLENGYAVHKCIDCGDEYKVCFSCSKRFCNKCGYRRTENWVNKAKSKELNVGHRHIIFTIPSELWGIFA